jgi:tetratricopeptide (TPR) repeat protein
MPVRDRWLTVRAGRRLQIARYWQARSELDEAAANAYRAGRLLDGPPPTVLAADVAYTTAQIERDRARYPDSQRLFERAAKLLRGLVPGVERDQRMAHVHVGLADLHRRAGRYLEAVAELDAAREIAGATAPIVMLLGIIAKEQGRFDEAARRYAEVQQLGLRPAETATLQHNLAGLANARQDYAAAERHARHAVRLRRADRTATAVEVAQDVAILAAAVAGQQRYAEARDLFGQALSACRAARPIRDYEVAVHLHNLAAIEQHCGDVEAAERLYRETLVIKERLLGAEHYEVALVMNNLATVLRDTGRFDEAAGYFRRALTVSERTFPADHPLCVTARANLAGIEDRGDQPTEVGRVNRQ